MVADLLTAGCWFLWLRHNSRLPFQEDGNDLKLSGLARPLLQSVNTLPQDVNLGSGLRQPPRHRLLSAAGD